MSEKVDAQWRYFGYFDCCGASRARGHADLCPRSLAQAIEAETGETERLDPKGESAVPKECAPNLSPEDNN